jgi:hypothetical protein
VQLVAHSMSRSSGERRRASRRSCSRAVARAGFTRFALRANREPTVVAMMLATRCFRRCQQWVLAVSGRPFDVGRASRGAEVRMANPPQGGSERISLRIPLFGDENAAYLYNAGENYWFSPITSLNQKAGPGQGAVQPVTQEMLRSRWGINRECRVANARRTRNRSGHRQLIRCLLWIVAKRSSAGS